MADAQAQPPVVATAQLGVDVAQAVVAAVAAAFFQLDLAGGKVQLVVRHQDLLGLDFKKPCQRPHRFARQVHKRLRLQQPQRLPLHRGAGRQAPVAALGLQLDFELAGEGINPPKASVVARGGVFRARIAQADK